MDRVGQQDTGLLIERAIALALIAALIFGVMHVLLPFATGIVFATILAVAAWPLRQMLVARGWRPGLVATLLALLSVCVVPLAVAPALVDQVTAGVGQLGTLLTAAPSTAPAWVAEVPFLGGRLPQACTDVMAGDGRLAGMIAPYCATISATLLGLASGLAGSIVQLLIALAVAGMVWFSGDDIIAAMTDAAERLGWAVAAAAAVGLAGGAIRGGAHGVVGTAVIQGVLMAIGLAIAGVPGAAGLCFLAMLFSVSQTLSPLIVAMWAGAAWWLYDGGSLGWAIFMAVWGATFVSTSDNLLRPILISRGMDMPPPLILVGVFGGFVAFGFLGLFIGPTLLAVAFSLSQAWRAARPPQPRKSDT